MASVRLFDVFNCFIGATQVLGAREFEAHQQHRIQTAQGDGLRGLAARDRGPLSMTARLACDDIEQFCTLVGLFEANDSVSIEACGKIAQTLVGSSYRKVTANRMKLTAARLALQQGSYATADFDFVNSAAAASDSAEDELAQTVISAGSITHANKSRGVRVVGASFDPNGAAAAIVPENVKALTIDLRLQQDSDYGDDDYAEVAETAGYELTGTLEFADSQLTGALTIGQALLDADWGELTINYQQQAKTTAASLKKIVLQNLFWDGERSRLLARKFGRNILAFGCFFQAGANAYDFTDGTYKIMEITDV